MLRRAALLSLLGLWLALLTGCNPLVVDAPHNPTSSTGSSYLPYVLVNGQIMRWTRTNVAVSIDTTNLPVGWSPVYEQYVLDGLQQWQGNSGGALSFSRVDSNANISIRWVYQISGTANATGETEIALMENRFLPPSIALATAVGGQPISNAEMRATAIHELGHAIGLFGHSPNSQDVMFASSAAVRLSSNDIATLLDLYSHEAQIWQVDAQFASVRDAQVIRIYKAQTLRNSASRP